MKLINLLFIVVVVIFCSFKHKETHSMFSSTFYLGFGGYQFNPTDYISGTIISCPGDGRVCSISIPLTDVYTPYEVAALGLPVTYIGFPKVNDFSAGGLGYQIQIALITAGENNLPQKGRIIYEEF
uniref:hypothetical protein n=1 Tax=Pedobacter schmidteae TaxID=2201271 RepID=UPI0013CF23AE|nr:hypothetical protein [Pedobacter schmidteae]